MGIAKIALNFVTKQGQKLVQKGKLNKKHAYEDIYARAKSYVDNISESEISEVVNNVFKPKGSKNEFLSVFGEFKTIVPENLPKEVQKALNTIETKATKIANRTDKLNSEGKKVKSHLHLDFQKRYKREFEIIKNHLGEEALRIGNLGFSTNKSEYFAVAQKYNNALEKFYHIADARLGENRITEIPNRILPKDKIVYHGTKRAKAIINEGFSPLHNNQLAESPRECGAGIYLTPDKDVAAHFAGIRGQILLIKANVKNTAFVTQDKQDNLLSKIRELLFKKELISPYYRDEFGNAVTELTMQRVYKAAGFDSVYTPNGLGGGLSTSIDNYIGKKQSQLVIFDNKNTNILSKNIKDKILNEVTQIKQKIRTLISSTKFTLRNPEAGLIS